MGADRQTDRQRHQHLDWALAKKWDGVIKEKNERKKNKKTKKNHENHRKAEQNTDKTGKAM